MDVEMDGFDDFEDSLGALADRAEELDGDNEVTLGELLSPSFMQRYTDFESLEEFFEASPWTVETEDDLEEIPDDKFNEYVDQHTEFSDDEEMLAAAGEYWVARQLGFER